MWQTDRSTSSLVSVQLGDARADVVEAYQSTAALSVADPATGDVQRTLTVSMNHVVDLLNTAVVLVGRQPPTNATELLGHQLRTAADELAGGPPS
jgi:hypothetical protein